MKKSNGVLYISLVLLLLPIIIFFLFYLKLYIGIPCTIILLICTYKLIKDEDFYIETHVSDEEIQYIHDMEKEEVVEYVNQTIQEAFE